MPDPKLETKYPCPFCKEGPDFFHKNNAVFMRETEKGPEYRCGVGNSKCSLLQMYKMYGSHTHEVVGKETTTP